MNSISHQQRMMEIQHMSNACLVTLLPRVQESLQGAVKDGSVLFCFFLQLRQIRAGTFNVYILIKYLQKFKGLSNTNTGETNAHTLVQ